MPRRSSSWWITKAEGCAISPNCANAWRKAGAEIHVVKNSIFRIAAKEAGVAELNGSLAGQMAVVTGQKDISAAAKVVKTFGAEFDKLKVKFGYLNNQRLGEAAILRLADLPSLEVLRGKLLGVLERSGHASWSTCSTRRRANWLGCCRRAADGQSAANKTRTFEGSGGLHIWLTILTHQFHPG